MNNYWFCLYLIDKERIMGFFACGFTSSKHDCCIGCMLMCFDGIITMIAIYLYIFLWLHICIGISCDIEYFVLIGAAIHICASIFLFWHDIHFKSDTMFFAMDGDSTINDPRKVRAMVMETNQFGEKEDGVIDWKINPWALYCKHYVITTFKIICLILDFTILIMFTDSWTCTN